MFETFTTIYQIRRLQREQVSHPLAQTQSKNKAKPVMLKKIRALCRLVTCENQNLKKTVNSLITLCSCLWYLECMICPWWVLCICSTFPTALHTPATFHCSKTKMRMKTQQVRREYYVPSGITHRHIWIWWQIYPFAIITCTMMRCCCIKWEG